MSYNYIFIHNPKTALLNIEKLIKEKILDCFKICGMIMVSNAEKNLYNCKNDIDLL